MSWFKSCAVALLLIMYCLVVKGQPIDCNSSTANKPIVTGTAGTNPYGCTSYNGSITVYAEVAAGQANPTQWQYSINGGTAWRSSNTFTGLGPGNYNVAVRNVSNGCGDSYDDNPVILDPWQDNSLIINTTNTEPSFCGNNDGKIVVSVQGGSAPYSYRINGGSWTSSSTFSNLGSGTYTIEVLSNGGICSNSTTTKITKSPAPNISIQTTPTSGCGATDGAIDIVTSGDADLEYSIDGGNSWSGTTSFSNLSPGSYSVKTRYVGDTRCTSQSNVYIGGTVDVNISSISVTPTSSCTTTDGKITVTASGSGTLKYSINGQAWQSSNILSNLAPGNYNVYVRNGDGSCETAYGNNPV